MNVKIELDCNPDHVIQSVQHSKLKLRHKKSHSLANCPVLLVYLDVEEAEEVGALWVVLDEAEHASVLEAPGAGTVGQRHEKLGHCGAQRLGWGEKKNTANSPFTPHTVRCYS